MKKALIDKNNFVVAVMDKEVPVAIGLIWVDCPDYVTSGNFKYENKNFIEIQEPIPAPTAEQNKERAIQSLKNSDFSVLADVNLQNKSEWEAYRAILRGIAINPQAGFITWPQRPSEIWG